MTVPFNNGKIQMGKYYQKPMYIEEDPDMLAIQSSLLGDSHRIRFNYWVNAIYRVALAFVILVVILKNKG